VTDTATPSPDNATPSHEAVTTQKILDAYREVLTSVFVATLVAIGVLVGVYWFNNSPSIFPFVIGAGVLGALFSSLLRLYDYEDLPKALMGEGLGLGHFSLVIYALVPLVVGAIAAAAVYLACMSGLLQGDLFPTFECHLGKDMCSKLKDWAQEYGPMGPQNYAKAIVWGFIAGFSERFVPDLLQNLAAKAKEK
jgi:hypothetical protein